ncbi:thioredoxin-disulfide reductase [Herpetosiphon gulosus]|uniref:Thioredoxin reductase n=1 Tax=Herpetosiphon gulosus TaxID=1973496 RepID=A0ABP9WVV9_9CHLR
MEKQKVTVIGSGPAGLTAALYAARANLTPLVIRGIQPGGLIATTSEVENYPGFPDAINGFDLADKMEKQAARFGTHFLDGIVEKVELGERPFKLHIDNGTIVETETLIIATGASPRKLGVPGELELANRGVSYCAVCDGFFFRDKTLVVVGGGNSALDESLFLTRYAKEVHIIHRRDQLRADPVLIERAQNNPKIKFIWDTVVTKVEGTVKVEGVGLQNVKTGAESTFAADGVFPYIGHIPNTWLFKDQIELDENGYIVSPGRARTNVPGVFVAGDVEDHVYRQAITAAGSGCMAAMEASWFLDQIEHEQTSLAQW